MISYKRWERDFLSFFFKWGELMVEKRIEEAIVPALSELNLNIYKIVYERENGKNYLRIFLEKEDCTLDLDTCVKASEIISKILDDIDPISEEYFLEVTSCGERELVSKEDYIKAVNQYILVQVSEPILTYDELVGDLVAANDEGIELRINLKGRMKTVSIPFNIIEKAHLTFKF